MLTVDSICHVVVDVKSLYPKHNLACSAEVLWGHVLHFRIQMFINASQGVTHVTPTPLVPIRQGHIPALVIRGARERGWLTRVAYLLKCVSNFVFYSQTKARFPCCCMHIRDPGMMEQLFPPVYKLHAVFKCQMTKCVESYPITTTSQEGFQFFFWFIFFVTMVLYASNLSNTSEIALQIQSPYLGRDSIKVTEKILSF